MTNNRTCSFRGVRIGEVFVPLVEHRNISNHAVVEDRDGNRVKFRRVPRPGRLSLTHKTFSKWGGEPKSVMDNRQYVKTSDTLAMEINYETDAIFGASDQVVVIGNIDDMLKEVA